MTSLGSERDLAASLPHTILCSPKRLKCQAEQGTQNPVRALRWECAVRADGAAQTNHYKLTRAKPHGLVGAPTWSACLAGIRLGSIPRKTTNGPKSNKLVTKTTHKLSSHSSGSQKSQAHLFRFQTIREGSSRGSRGKCISCTPASGGHLHPLAYDSLLHLQSIRLTTCLLASSPISDSPAVHLS